MHIGSQEVRYKSMSTTLNNKIIEAQHRIEELYKLSRGRAILAFSGGKDSMVVLSLIKQCEEALTIDKNAIVALFSNTGMELQQTIDFVNWVNDNYYPVTTIQPKLPFGEIMKLGKPIKSKFISSNLGRFQKTYKQDKTYLKIVRDEYKSQSMYLGDKNLHLAHPLFDIKISNECCNYLKKYPSKDWQEEHDYLGTLTGERSGEGGLRSYVAQQRSSSGGRLCLRFREGTPIMSPIIDWGDDEVDEYIKLYNIPLSKAYTLLGMKRTGCIGCPFAQDLESNLELLFIHDKPRYKAIMYYLKDVYIAQNIDLPFDRGYQIERRNKWQYEYSDLRYRMIFEHRNVVHEYKDRDKNWKDSMRVEDLLSRLHDLPKYFDGDDLVIELVQWFKAFPIKDIEYLAYDIVEGVMSVEEYLEKLKKYYGGAQ